MAEQWSGSFHRASKVWHRHIRRDDASFLGTPPPQVLAYMPGNRWGSEPSCLWLQVSTLGPPTEGGEGGSWVSARVPHTYCSSAAASWETRALSFQPGPCIPQLGLFSLGRLIPSVWQVPGLEGHCKVLSVGLLQKRDSSCAGLGPQIYLRV